MADQNTTLQASPLLRGGRSNSGSTTYDTILPTPTDDSNCKEHKKLLRELRNILTTLVSVTVIVLIVIISLNSWFIYIHEEIITKPQYLLFPVDSTFRLPVDSTEYGSMEFSLTDHAQTITITFILGTYYNGYNSSDFTINDANCDLNRKPITSSRSDCFIARYWPAYDDIPDPEGYITCDSSIQNEDKSPFLIWQWFPFQVYNHSHIPMLDFKIDSFAGCTDVYSYHKCTSLSNQLSVADILQDRSDGDSIVMMGFCTYDDIDAVDYTTVFHEPRPKFVTPYNKYILSNVNYFDDETVTVPLSNDDKHIDIVVTGSGTDPVKIQLNRRASVTRMLEDIRVYNGAIAVIVLSIILLFIHIGLAIAIVCSFKKYGRR